MEAADSCLHAELTAVVDGLLRAAVLEICALADRWRDGLRMEITARKIENEQLKRKLQVMEQSLCAARATGSADLGHHDKKTQFPEAGTNPNNGTATLPSEISAQVPKSASEAP